MPTQEMRDKPLCKLRVRKNAQDPQQHSPPLGMAGLQESAQSSQQVDLYVEVAVQKSSHWK